jgi:hypothetical protein
MFAIDVEGGGGGRVGVDENRDVVCDIGIKGLAVCCWYEVVVVVVGNVCLVGDEVEDDDDAHPELKGRFGCIEDGDIGCKRFAGVDDNMGDDRLLLLEDHISFITEVVVVAPLGVAGLALKDPNASLLTVVVDPFTKASNEISP